MLHAPHRSRPLVRNLPSAAMATPIKLLGLFSDEERLTNQCLLVARAYQMQTKQVQASRELGQQIQAAMKCKQLDSIRGKFTTKSMRKFKKTFKQQLKLANKLERKQQRKAERKAKKLADREQRRKERLLARETGTVLNPGPASDEAGSKPKKTGKAQRRREEKVLAMKKARARRVNEMKNMRLGMWDRRIMAEKNNAALLESSAASAATAASSSKGSTISSTITNAATASSTSSVTSVA